MTPEMASLGVRDAEGMEGLREVKAKLGVYLHPSRAANVQQGVREILNSLLLRHSEEFEGVVLAYLDPTIQGRTGGILSGLSPYFHVHLTATLILFSPKVGMTIEGKVNKVERDYLGVVVLGLFNAAIGVSDIREDLYYNESAGTRAWMSESDDQHSIKLGSIICFSVKSVQESEEIIDICGSLQGSLTGSVDWLAAGTRHKERRQTISPNSRSLENGAKLSKHNQAKRKERISEASEGINRDSKKRKKREKQEMRNENSHKSKRQKGEVGEVGTG